MTDATTTVSKKAPTMFSAPRTPSSRRKQTTEALLGGLLLATGTGLALLAGAFLALPLSAGMLFSLTFPRKGLASWIGALLCGVAASFLAFKHGQASWEDQKGAFLALLGAQNAWFLENWPRYVTDGPSGVQFGAVAPIWAYWLFVGVILGVVSRKAGLWRLAWSWCGIAPSPRAPSAVSSPAAVLPQGGEKATAAQKTDDIGRDTPASQSSVVPVALLRRLFPRKDAWQYTVLCERRWGIRHWYSVVGKFGWLAPHLVPATTLYRGIDRVFGDFHTRLRAQERVKTPGSTHPSVYHVPIQATDTHVHGTATRFWHIGHRVLPSVNGTSQYTPTVYTWGDVGKMGSVELLVSPPKVGKTSLCMHLANAQRTGSPFLGWPTLQCGLVWLVEESASEFDAKRRRASGLPPAPPAPERVSATLWRHRISRSDSQERQFIPNSAGNTPKEPFSLSATLYGIKTALLSSAFVLQHRLSGQEGEIPQLFGVSFVRRSVALASKTSVQQGLRPDSARSFLGTVSAYLVNRYGITRNKVRTRSPGPVSRGKQGKSSAGHTPLSPGALLAVLYGPSVPRGLSTLAEHLAMACTIAHVRSTLSGVPWYLQLDSLFHWCPEAEQDASAAKTAMNTFKAVADLGFLVRVCVHADETTGAVKGPQNITRDADRLFHIWPVPKTAKARETDRRSLSPEGRFEERPRPDPLIYHKTSDGSLNLSADAGRMVGRPAKPALASVADGADETNEGREGATHANGQHPQETQPDRAQRMSPLPPLPGTQQQGRAKTERNILALLDLVPDHGQPPRPAADVVKDFRVRHGLQADRVYTLAREAEQRGLLEITANTARRHQWRRKRLAVQPEPSEPSQEAGSAGVGVPA